MEAMEEDRQWKSRDRGREKGECERPDEKRDTKMTMTTTTTIWCDTKKEFPNIKFSAPIHSGCRIPKYYKPVIYICIILNEIETKMWKLE